MPSHLYTGHGRFLLTAHGISNRPKHTASVLAPKYGLQLLLPSRSRLLLAVLWLGASLRSPPSVALCEDMFAAQDIMNSIDVGKTLRRDMPMDTTDGKEALCHGIK